MVDDILTNFVSTSIKKTPFASEFYGRINALPDEDRTDKLLRYTLTRTTPNTTCVITYGNFSAKYNLQYS